MRKPLHFCKFFLEYKFLHTLSLFLLLFFSNQKTNAQAGTLDPTFAIGGILEIDSFVARDLSLIQPDGKIILLSMSENGGAVVSRLNEDGSFDQTFGKNGRAYFSYDGRIKGNSQEMALQNDGKLVFTNFCVSLYKISVGIIRCNPNGSPDSSFGINGLDTVAMDNQNFARGIVIQPDGKIVVSGDVHYSSFDADRTFIFRLNKNGGLDSKFGSGGTIITKYQLSTYAGGLALRTDGKIIKGVTFDSDGKHPVYQLESFNPDGSIDDKFGVNGVAKYIFGQDEDARFYSKVYRIALQTDGKVVCTGTSGLGPGHNASLCRFNQDGSVDENFGENGGFIVPNPGMYDDVLSYDVKIQTDGKIIICGDGGNGYPNPIFLARFTANGQLDPEFGINGIIRTVANNENSFGDQVNILSDSKILVSGKVAPNHILLIRYNGDNVLAVNFKEVKVTQTKDAITITWQTLNESGIKSFTIERSSNANDYVGINTVAAKGIASNYNYTDKNPLSGTSYYRIRENAANGTNTFSPVVKVVFNDNRVISLYPNPAKNTVTVKGLNKSITTNIRITDMNGREISKQNFTQCNTATLNIRALAHGIYFVLVEENGKVTKLRIIKE